MAFSEATKEAAFERSGGRCECARLGHDHGSRCPRRIGRHSARFHHHRREIRGGSDGLANCEAVCKYCHDLIHRRLDARTL